MARYIADESHAYFCTITVLDWIPVFIDERYIHPIIESLDFTRRNKGTQLYGFVIMPNHLHMIAASEALHANMRDFKRFTSNRIHQLLVADHRTTCLEWLQHAAQRARRSRGEFSFWSSGFHPQAIWSRSVFEQKLRYLYANPMRKGLVATPEAWRFSSAGFYAGESEPLLRMDLWDGSLGWVAVVHRRGFRRKGFLRGWVREGNLAPAMGILPYRKLTHLVVPAATL